MRARRITFPRTIACVIPLSMAVGLALLAYQSPDEKRKDHGSVAHQANRLGAEARTSSLIEEIANDPTTQIGEPAAAVVPVMAPRGEAVRNLAEAMKDKGDRVSVESIQQLVLNTEGQSVSWKLGGMDWSGKVLSRNDEDGVLRMAIELDDQQGSMIVNLQPDQTIWASVMFNGESHAVSMRGKPENGHWAASFTQLDKVLCSPVNGTFPPSRGSAMMPYAGSKAPAKTTTKNKVSKAPNLNSNPDSDFVFYIDFDGEVVDNPEWTIFTNGRTINAAPHARADDDEFVTRIWERVVEDFAPFNVNVTTERAVFDAASPNRRMMCIVTPTWDVAPGSGGVAFLDSFGSDIPCWCFNPTEDTIGDTISHEIGHTLGLRHDGLLTGVEYYGGQGDGAVSWAPIMGAYFADFEPPFINEELTQWSRGEYPDANNQEDDLAIIANERNGFGYRQDDHADTTSEATFVQVADSKVNLSGIVEQTSDVDYFSVPTSGGIIDLRISAIDVDSPEHPQRGANLAIAATLYDENGRRVAESNVADGIDAGISLRLNAGIYYLAVEGAGRGDLATGFSDYASLGQYTITGVLPQDNIVKVTPPEATISREGGRGSFVVENADKWTWSTEDSWITSNLFKDQSGKRTFTYEVERNPSKNIRVGTITVKSGVFTAIHTVTQNGSNNDDHGDIFTEATPVDQESSTPGVIEDVDDTDMFRIDVLGYGNLTVSTSGSTDTVGTFYNSIGQVLATDDESLSPNFTMTRKVSTGTYYVAVRHSIEGGTGSYTFNASFKSRAALIISPKKRLVGPSGGNYLLDVISSKEWTWSASAKWLALAPGGVQEGGTRLPYRVLPNNTPKERTARITIRSGRNQIVHTITQTAAGQDDHSNDLEGASELAANGKQSGNIQFDGDADMFRIRLGTSGLIELTADSRIDTVAELLDSQGNLILKVDEGNGDNFVLRAPMNAGTYYLRVTAFGGLQIGSYTLRSSYTPSDRVNVVYRHSSGGSIRGASAQSVSLGQDASSVAAMARPGFSFLKWSDGVRSSKRSDRGLLSHLDVTAEFVSTLEVTHPGGKVFPGSLKPVDYGIIREGGARGITFTIKNNGAETLSDLTITPRGIESASWRAAQPSRTRLAPGKTSTVRIVLSGKSTGYFNTQWEIRAKGMNKAFILRTMGVVSNTDTMTALSAKVADGSGAVALPAALPWIDVSSDGFFRYRFERKTSDTSEQIFWISADGVTWEEGIALDVWKTKAGDRINEFEAILAPPRVSAPRILVMESDPASTSK